MKNDNIVYLFFGFGCEYVLNPLFNFMVNKGYNCIEIDMIKDKNPVNILKQLRNEKVVFITSAHFILDKMNYKLIYDIDAETLTPLEVIDYLRPYKKIYYPHDLTTPLLDEELRWLDFFDVMLSPLPYLEHLNYFTKIIEVGWIKKNNKINGIKIDNNKLSLGYTFSSVKRFKTFNSAYEFWGPIWEQDVKIKLAYWPGYEIYEEELKKRNIYVYPIEKNTIEVISDNDVIITSSTTSVNIEASLCGKTVINVVDGTVSQAEQKKYTAGLPNIYVVSRDECMNILSDLKSGNRKIKLGKQILKDFDYDKALKAIIS
jgi:hypothetical protein